MRVTSSGRPAARAIRTPRTANASSYRHTLPGCSRSGSFANRAIHSSGGGRAGGSGGPNPSSSSVALSTAGHSISNTQPKPNRMVSKSSIVTGRRAGSVSSSGPSRRLKTRRSTSSGRNRSTGSSRPSTPSWASSRVSAAIIGFVFELIRTWASTSNGSSPAGAVVPSASTVASPRSRRPTTAPGTTPASTNGRIASINRSVRIG